MDKHEVTQAEYERVMATNPSRFKGCPTCPVENVSWNDAAAFCAKIGKRLPTEAEWEYAARAGTTTKYYWGNEMNGDYAWYAGNSGLRTHPVAQKRPNAWGLYDMSGNVWEWCADWLANYSAEPETNPTGSTTGTNRVARGGSDSPLDDGSDGLVSAYRNGQIPDGKWSNYGFRCVRSQENSTTEETSAERNAATDFAESRGPKETALKERVSVMVGTCLSINAPANTIVVKIGLREETLSIDENTKISRANEPIRFIDIDAGSKVTITCKTIEGKKVASKITIKPGYSIGAHEANASAFIGHWIDQGGENIEITYEQEVLHVRYSSGRTASGELTGPNSVQIHFDSNCCTGQLLSPNSIQWSNGTTWTRS
jgi:hypothetical protein